MSFDSIKKLFLEMKESTSKMFDDMAHELDDFPMPDLPKGTIVEETVTETENKDGSFTKVTKRTYKVTKEG